LAAKPETPARAVTEQHGVPPTPTIALRPWHWWYYAQPVGLTSTGFRTDLSLRALEGSQISDYKDCIVVRSPANPGFRQGNFILLREPPRPGDAQGWIARFREEFPEADYTTLGIDVAEAGEANVTEFLAAGFGCQVDSVLTAPAVRVPPHLNQYADYRPVASEQDWNEAASLAQACHPGDLSVQDFLNRRMATRRRLAEDGHGAWFGAFLHQRLAAHLGIFKTADGVARFQDVETHPDSRRQGLAGSLVYAATRYALTNLAARTLVIVADPDDGAIRLYRSLGFADKEQQVMLERLAPIGARSG
jgi:ribosomal protein S18 acetylase RimI-like enzyme